MKIERHPCPQDWTGYVKGLATEYLTKRAARALRTIRDELADAQEAEALGIQPPAGGSSQELQALLQQRQQAFKTVHDAIQGATTIADINAALQDARTQGLDWLVGPEWEPYPDTCPW